MRLTCIYSLNSFHLVLFTPLKHLNLLMNGMVPIGQETLPNAETTGLELFLDENA